VRSTLLAALVHSAIIVASDRSLAQSPAAAPAILTGTAAYGDWRSDAPGLRRRLSAADLPVPYASRSAGNPPGVVAAPRDAALKVPAGFTVRQLAGGLENPRVVRVAPNGDIFVAESSAGRIRVLRMADGATRPERSEIFAGDLEGPFGIAFYPPGGNPQFVYVANTASVLRFPYRNGDLKARGRSETIVARLPDGGHWTRDIAFPADGGRMFVSVGSASNGAQGLPTKSADAIRSWESVRGLGAAWASEENRADVLALDPDGRALRVFATGLRNCVGLAIQPQTGDLWCSTNERDGLGDDLPPDFVTRVREGGFYGWPWFYIGDHEDPRHKGERPDLAGKVVIPDVLLQPHSAPLAMTFYDAPATAASVFPASYRGDAFVAMHGSWNRSKRTGYKVVRIPLDHGVPSGAYEDFLTGFVVDDGTVWGRPVGVAVARDGALLVTEDGNGTLWRVAYAASARPQP
jgi:glucose/arabinose dehydrogenase